MARTDVEAGARGKAAPGKAAFRRPRRRSIKVWICRYERAPLTIAKIENRITPACPYIFPSARRRSGMAARQVRRSVVMSNLRGGLLPWIQTGLRSERGKTSFTAPLAPLSDRALNSPGRDHQLSERPNQSISSVRRTPTHVAG